MHAVLIFDARIYAVESKSSKQLNKYLVEVSAVSLMTGTLLNQLKDIREKLKAQQDDVSKSEWCRAYFTRLQDISAGCGRVIKQGHRLIQIDKQEELLLHIMPFYIFVDQSTAEAWNYIWNYVLQKERETFSFDDFSMAQLYVKHTIGMYSLEVLLHDLVCKRTLKEHNLLHDMGALRKFNQINKITRKEIQIYLSLCQQIDSQRNGQKERFDTTLNKLKWAGLALRGNWVVSKEIKLRLFQEGIFAKWQGIEDNAIIKEGQQYFSSEEIALLERSDMHDQQYSMLLMLLENIWKLSMDIVGLDAAIEQELERLWSASVKKIPNETLNAIAGFMCTFLSFEDRLKAMRKKLCEPELKQLFINRSLKEKLVKQEMQHLEDDYQGLSLGWVSQIDTLYQPYYVGIDQLVYDKEKLKKDVLCLKEWVEQWQASFIKHETEQTNIALENKGITSQQKDVTKKEYFM